MPYEILFADDNYFYRYMASRYFPDVNFRVITVSNGYDALVVLLRGTIDLAVLDFQLSELTAEKIIVEMRNCGISVPVIVVTGDESIETERRVRGIGVDYYFVKPLRIEDIKSVSYHILQRKKEFIYFDTPCRGKKYDF